ncbi:MAG TPA: hypothetical protein VMC83_42650 [Streptosporangiaceae bacterium]|nr:hypothetical protein [Streptosporangiaceae bacterium]
MVPAGYHDFFNGCASVAGALIGLLFVALSVSPAKLTGAESSAEHQVRAAAAFSALVNTLVVALSAMLPGTSLGDVGITLGCAGLATTSGLVVVLYREHQQKIGRGDIRMLAILLALYGLELANAVELGRSPHSAGGVSRQAWLAIFFFLFGIARSWQLAGARGISLASTVGRALDRGADESDA